MLKSTILASRPNRPTKTATGSRPREFFRAMSNSRTAAAASTARAHEAEKPEDKLIGSVAGDHAQNRREQHIDGRGKGVDPFADGVNQAVARSEVFADTVGDVIVFPGVIGVGRERQGNGEDPGKDQPATGSISAPGEWKSTQNAHTSR